MESCIQHSQTFDYIELWDGALKPGLVLEGGRRVGFRAGKRDVGRLTLDTGQGDRIREEALRARGDPNVIHFELLDAKNLADWKIRHLVGLTLTLRDANRPVQERMFREDRKHQTGVFDVHRKR